jgi:transposase-like protein
MTQYNFTLSGELFHQLFLGDRDKGVAQLLENVLNQVLQQQAEDQIQAKSYERTDKRQAYRNGSYDRQMNSRVGSITLSVPRIRGSKFTSNLFSRYQRSEQALILTMMEMVINGVSTRKVSEITQELCGTEFSKSTVSDLCKRLDPIVNGWNSRPLLEKRYPFVVVDALYIKIREDHQVRSRAMLVAIGVNEDGHREILGIQIGDSESEESWGQFFSSLKARGLKGVDVLTSDQHRGLVKAAMKHFQGVMWQRCQVHFLRNIINATPKQHVDKVVASVKGILYATTPEAANTLLKQTLDEFEKLAPKAMEILESGFADATAVLTLPEKYRKRIRTSNSLERLNEEIRRRERVIRIFPGRDSAIRLIGAYVMDIHERWGSGKKYLEMTEYFKWKQQQNSSNKVVQVPMNT